MEDVRAEKNSRQIVFRTCGVFLLTFLAALLLITYTVQVNIQQERGRMEHFAQSIGAETYEILLSEMGKTRVLEAYLLQTEGSYENFERISHVLLREPFVRNVLFAPDGIVEAVYPLKGNEAVIGLNMYEEGAGNKEAQAAIEKQELYMAGPFDLIQGGAGIAGRLPVFLEDETGASVFWGIVSVTLDFPEVLSGSSIDRLNEQGFACEVWRINPDSGKRQTILTTEIPLKQDWDTIDFQQELFNSVWTVSIAPLQRWYSQTSFWMYLAAGLLISFLAAMGIYYVEKLRLMRAEASKREIERLLAQLEYEQGNMLFSQIRSHFFYHTLNSLQALIVLNPDAAYKMAGDFSRYLRFNLDSVTSAGGIGSFREELRAVRAYADINQMQLGDRLTMKFDVPDVDFQMLALTIQPIVENAILHGIKPKVGGGTVCVKLEETAEHWRVIVEDDGVGFEYSPAVGDRSIGLSIVRQRMDRSPGCGIEIRSTPGQGTIIVLSYKKED